jgi:hypothetical protein
MSPIAWIFLAVLGGIGLYESIKVPPLSPTLEYVNQDQMVVVRMSGPSINFPLLDARITLPSDWTYLSTTSSELAEHPTFVNARAKSIIRLRPAWNIQWNQQDVTIERQEFDDTQIDWLTPSGAITSTAAKMDDLDVNVRWRAHEAARIGRLNRENIDLIVETVSHDPSGADEILAFFRSIEPGNER